MKLLIRDAVTADSEMLIELTGLTPIKGTIGLIIDRKPDFFKLLQQSDDYIALVATDESNNIKGCFMATRNKVRIGTTHANAYYLRDFKVHPDQKGSTIAYRLVKEMYERLLKSGADILCCTTAAGNHSVMPFFAGRAGIPAFIEASTFNVYEILPRRNAGEKKVKSTENTEQGKTFMNNFFRQYAFCPSEITEDALCDCLNFTAEENGNIAAVVAGFDPSPYKQNIVTSYSFAIAAILAILRLLKLFLPLAPLPGKNEPLKILYARYYGFIKEKETHFIDLIDRLRAYAFNNGYHFVSIAADKKDIKMNKLVKPLSSFVFKSSLMVTSLQNNTDALQQISKGINFEDYALV